MEFVDINEDLYFDLWRCTFERPVINNGVGEY
jgi:hypothetical protein